MAVCVVFLPHNTGSGVVVIASPHNSRAETVMYSVIQLALFSTLLKLLMQKADFEGDIYDWGAITGVIVCVNT